MKWASIIVVVCTAALLSAQNQTLKVNVEIVQLYATVTDSEGRYVRDLKRDHFQVSEDGVDQKIEGFSADDVPASVGIILDVGGSMKGNLGVARQGAMTFLNAGNLDNEYFLIEFNKKAEVTEDFTRDLNKLRNHNTFLPATREKAVYDALYLGLEKLRDGVNPHKMLLVLTSGGDLSSQHKASEVKALARQLDAQIFGVDLPTEANIHGDFESTVPTAEIIESLGGQNFVSGDGADYLNICRRISVSARNQYSITYRSTNPEHDGKFRKIGVKLNLPKGIPPLTVHARNGYYAAEPQ